MVILSSPGLKNSAASAKAKSGGVKAGRVSPIKNRTNRPDGMADHHLVIRGIKASESPPAPVRIKVGGNPVKKSIAFRFTLVLQLVIARLNERYRLHHEHQ